MKIKKRVGSGKYNAMMIILVVGMLISLYLLYEHFSTTTSEFCKFGESFDCGIVNKSPYANIDGLSYLLTIDFGLPLPFLNLSGLNLFLDFLTSNAFLGFLTLLFLMLLLKAINESKDFLWIKKKNTIKWAKGIALFGVIYGFYLFLIQHFILQTYCIFCIALDLVLVTLLILIWRIKQ